MLFKKTYELWLDRVAVIPHKFKYWRGHKVTCSKHLTYPARMLRKLKRLKYERLRKPS